MRKGDPVQFRFTEKGRQEFERFKERNHIKSNSHAVRKCIQLAGIVMDVVDSNRKYDYAVKMWEKDIADVKSSRNKNADKNLFDYLSIEDQKEIIAEVRRRLPPETLRVYEELTKEQRQIVDKDTKEV